MRNLMTLLVAFFAANSALASGYNYQCANLDSSGDTGAVSESAIVTDNSVCAGLPNDLPEKSATKSSSGELSGMLLKQDLQPETAALHIAAQNGISLLDSDVVRNLKIQSQLRGVEIFLQSATNGDMPIPGQVGITGFGNNPEKK